LSTFELLIVLGYIIAYVLTYSTIVHLKIEYNKKMSLLIRFNIVFIAMMIITTVRTVYYLIFNFHNHFNASEEGTSAFFITICILEFLFNIATFYHIYSKSNNDEDIITVKKPTFYSKVKADQVVENLETSAHSVTIN
jgi:hypothetical protein